MSLESRDEFLAGVRSLYERWGTNKYDEQVSQIEHAVQCAQHARDAAYARTTYLLNARLALRRDVHRLRVGCTADFGRANVGNLWCVFHLLGVGEHGVHLVFVVPALNPKLVLHGVTTRRFAFDPHWQTSSSNAFVLAAHSIDRFN